MIENIYDGEGADSVLSKLHQITAEANKVLTGNAKVKVARDSPEDIRRITEVIDKIQVIDASTITLYQFDITSMAEDDGVDSIKPAHILEANPGRWIKKFTFGGLNIKLEDDATIELNSHTLLIKSTESFDIFDSGFNSDVRALATQSDGKIIVGGAFSNYRGVTANKLIRLNPDGSVDTSFNVGAGPNGTIQAIAIQSDGKVIIGGGLTTYKGVTTARIARLHPNGDLDASFITGTGFNNLVNALLTGPEGKIIVGGAFTTYKGLTCNGFAVLLTDGSVDPSFTTGSGFNSAVYGLTYQSDGKLLVCGRFDTYNGTSASKLARLNPDGDLDSTLSLGTGFNSQINSVVVDSLNRIVVGGFFTNYNGTSLNRITRLLPTGVRDESFVTGSGLNSTVNGLALTPEDDILVVGTFTGYNGLSARRIVKIKSNGAIDTTFAVSIGFNSTTYVVSWNPLSNILIGGSFITYKDITANRLVSLDEFGNHSGILKVEFNSNGDIKYVPGSPSYSKLSSNVMVTKSHLEDRVTPIDLFNVIDSKVIPKDGLSFDHSIFRGGLMEDNELIISDGNKLEVRDIGLLGFNSHVRDTQMQSDGKIIVVGAFTSYRGVTCNRLVRLNQDGTIDSSFDTGSGLNDTANSVVIQPDGKLVLVGEFQTYKEVHSSKYIIRINPDGSYDSTFSVGSGFNIYPVKSVLQSDDKIIVYGFFTTYQGVSYKNIIRLNSDGSIDNSFTSYMDTDPRVVAVQSDGKILLGGSDVIKHNGNTYSGLIRLNSDGTLDPSFSLYGSVKNPISVIELLSDGRIIAGGSFFSIAGYASGSIISLNSDGSRDLTFNKGLGFNGETRSIQLLDTDKLLVFGHFTSYDRNNAPRVAVVNLDGSFNSSYDFGEGFDSPVFYSSVHRDNKVFTAGNYTKYRNSEVDGIALIDLDGNLVPWYRSTLFEEGLIKHSVNSHEYYDERTLVDKEYVDIKVSEGSGSSSASQVTVDASSFNNNLSGEEVNVQLALERIDSLPLTVMEWSYSDLPQTDGPTFGEFGFNAAKDKLFLSYVLDNINISGITTIQNYVNGIKSGSQIVIKDLSGNVLPINATGDAVQGAQGSAHAEIPITPITTINLTPGQRCLFSILPATPTVGDGGIEDAPADEVYYVRKDGTWVQMPNNSGIGDAPIDGNKYFRKDGAWVAESQILFDSREVSSGPIEVVQSDNNNIIRCTNTALIQETLPQLLAGTVITIRKAGTGDIELLAGPGMTLTGASNLRTQHTGLQLHYITSTLVDVWGGEL